MMSCSCVSPFSQVLRTAKAARSRPVFYRKNIEKYGFITGLKPPFKGILRPSEAFSKCIFQFPNNYFFNRPSRGPFFNRL